MTTAAELDERYGRTLTPARRRARWIVVGAIAAVLVGILSWVVVANSIDTVRADDVAMTVVDDRTVEVSFQVSGPTDREFACAIEALDEEFGVVGWRVVVLPASPDHTRVFHERIPTVAAATTGLVNSCWVT